MGAAAKWIEDNASHHERFMLFVDEFDPHEPFDTPEPYASMYDKDWEGEHMIWPPYMQGAIAKGVLTEAQARQVRACYGGKLTMIDHWFGKIMDALDAGNHWDDTVVIVCTDHGHYLGEKDIWGKPGVPIYQTLGHIPLMIAHPGIAPGTCDALTTSVDIFATLAEIFGVDVRQRTHGHSLLPLLRGEKTGIRDWLLTGVWGREVHYVDKRYKYGRAPQSVNAPLTMLSNRWSTMPTHMLTREQELPLPDDRAFLSRMPGSKIPVIRQDWQDGDKIPFWAYARFSGNHLYDLEEDGGETNNLAGSKLESDYVERLRDALRSLEAPDSQFVRLGLA